jgi:translation elongation factor EF-Tu-like GTPase
MTSLRNVALVAHVDHGKTTLTAAITATLAKKGFDPPSLIKAMDHYTWRKKNRENNNIIIETYIIENSPHFDKIINRFLFCFEEILKVKKRRKHIF